MTQGFQGPDHRETIVIIETTPDLIARLRAYADAFDASPAIFTLFPSPFPSASASSSAASAPLFPFAADTDKGLGILLLAASLHRPGARDTASLASSAPSSRHDVPAGVLTGFGADAAALLAALYRDYGNDLFKLNRLPFDPLRARVDAHAADWDAEERARVPGILRSVCDFFYRVGPLSSWVEDEPGWEQRVGEIAQEIYWMGAQSPTRTKARVFLWLACHAPGFAARAAVRTHAARFAWPVSDGHMRFLLDIVKPSRAQASALKRPEARGEAFAALARAVFPEAPWRLYAPLEAFLRHGGAAGLKCRAAVLKKGGCPACALSPLCPAAKNFPATSPAANPQPVPQG